MLHSCGWSSSDLFSVQALGHICFLLYLNYARHAHTLTSFSSQYFILLIIEECWSKAYFYFAWMGGNFSKLGNKGQNKRQTFNLIKIETFPVLRTKLLKLKPKDNIIKKPFLAIMQIIRTDH